jgi:hypothetical protein
MNEDEVRARACVAAGRDTRNHSVAVPDQPVDMVNHPPHYKKSWGEVIDVTENYSFCLGNVLKYILRSGEKGCPVEDLEKARWYLEREIKNRKAMRP